MRSSARVFTYTFIGLVCLLLTVTFGITLKMHPPMAIPRELSPTGVVAEEGMTISGKNLETLPITFAG
jgi:hypothetical protein